MRGRMRKPLIERPQSWRAFTPVLNSTRFPDASYEAFKSNRKRQLAQPTGERRDKEPQ